MNRIYDSNLKVYSDEKVCQSYVHANDLQLPEKKILAFLSEFIGPSHKILDVGIGTGRTIPYLKNLSPHYTGIDYSQRMVEIARSRFPSEDLRVCDVRDLGVFGEHEFDLVFFSFNGIDYISHEDRLIALQQIRRVLKPGGYLVFSSHNRKYKDFNKFKFTFSGNPLRAAWHFMKSFVHRANNLKRHIFTETYAIISDPGHFYRLLTYYIAAADQKQQLDSSGFDTTGLRIYDLNGEINSESNNSAWLHYLVSAKSKQ